MKVHRAVTICGKEVAVKLQYPGLEAQVGDVQWDTPGFV